MTTIAAELDQRLQQLDPVTAASVEQLVRDALRLAEGKCAVIANAEAVSAHRAHIARFAGIWAEDDLQRPTQGEFEKREDW